MTCGPATLPKHLPVLMAMFPGVVMLDVDQIASLTKYAKGTIDNLASFNRLPFKPARDLGERILVSIIELADYMDKTMLSDSQSTIRVEQVVTKYEGGSTPWHDNGAVGNQMLSERTEDSNLQS